MGTIIGVVVGYALGTHAGEEGWVDFKEAWKVISTSDEVRDLLAGGFSLGRDLLRRGTDVFSGATESGSRLRSAA
jgi:hypothetical protein